MEHPNPMDAPGRFEARYLAFLGTIDNLRPALHRYCARMLGSVMDGEDVVQDALFQAYRKLDTFDDMRPMGPWLFRIAHNQCIDFIRRHEVRRDAETTAMTPDWVMPALPAGRELGRAVEHLVLTLPPMERACVLLKDIFDYSLEEIAEMVDSTVGGVKAALNRGHSKLAALPETAPRPAEKSARSKKSTEAAQILRLYVDRFNRRDWDGILELVVADAQLRVADRFTGKLLESGYFGVYERWKTAWRLVVGEVDGETAIVRLEEEAGGWSPKGVIRFDVDDGRVVQIRDYWHCPWVLVAATSLVVGEPFPN
ncbi:MAG: sigma-70 family RNA polymerase sigma factor [Terracidiphilus sp.]